MAYIRVGGGVDVSEVTATASDVLSPKKFINANAEEVTGNIPTQSDSGNVTLNASTTSKNYVAGYYPNAHGAQVTLYDWA